MSRRIEFQGVRRLSAALGLSLAMVCGTALARAADLRSLPQDRERFVSITRSLEEAPLKPSLKADRAWALQWLTEAPDIAVSVCLIPLGGLSQENYSYFGEIVIQNMFSMAALTIQRPETAKDLDAQQLAGVDGALNAYRSILKDKPDAKSPALERLLEMETRGELPAFVHKALIRCSTEGSEELHVP